jgi:lysozyme
MKINKSGLEIIKRFEGCKLKAYLCPAQIWTIGYGSTHNVYEGLTISQIEANRRLQRDIEAIEAGISRFIKVDVNPNQYSACVSLAFNIGVGAFRNSTLLKMINAGELAKAAEQFLVWKYAGGKILPGLVKRREAERELFLTCLSTEH